MRLQNLYNTDVWAALCRLFSAAAIVRRDGSVELFGGNLGDNLAAIIQQSNSPVRNRLDAAFAGEHLEFMIDIDQSDLPEFLKVEPLHDEEGVVQAVLVTAEDAPKDVLRLTEVQSRLNEYEFIFRNIRQGIWQLDSKGIVVACNPYLAHWLEYTEAEIVGKPSKQFMASVDPAAKRASEPSDSFEAEFMTKSGIRRHGLVAACPTFAPDGRATGTIDIITDITAEHALQSKLVGEVQKMAKLASIDPLTGASNRLAFDVALESMQAAAKTSPFGVVVIDLNFFKYVNDTYGHPAGDQVLIDVVAKLKRFVRNTDVVARLGGDEFVVLLADASSELTSQIAKRLDERLQYFLSFEGNKIPVHVSVGWAHSSEKGGNVVQRADAMLYARRRESREGGSIADMAKWIDSQPEIL